MVEHRTSIRKDLWKGVQGKAYGFEIVEEKGRPSLHYYTDNDSDYKTDLIVEWVTPGMAKPRGIFIGKWENYSFYLIKNKCYPAGIITDMKEFFGGKKWKKKK